MDTLERVARAIAVSNGYADAALDAPAPGGLKRPVWTMYVKSAQAAIDSMLQWQPIESAPHDTEVLLYCPFRHETNPERVEVGKATTGERGPIKSTYSAHAWATHWMPLPDLSK